MNCSISGEVPEEPVASSKSGLVYEKRLIEHHISESGKCPVTGEPLTMNDLVPLKTGTIVKPHAAQSASIPGMLGMFQTEWDSLMLSNFACEQQLHTLRKELTHALYQNDAACRVIARLKRERDEARGMLLTQAETMTEVKAGEDEVINGPDNSKRSRIAGITESIISEITDCNAVLSGQRKKRQVSPTLAPVEEVERYTQLGSYPLHKTSKPGILCMDVHRSRDLIATGGADANSVVFDRSSGEILSALSGHSKKVTCVKFNAEGDLVLTGSADKTARMWRKSDNGDYNCRHVLKDHAAEVEAVTVHPTNNYFLTASLDKSWCFYDLSSGLCLNKTYDPEGEGFTTAAFHPDGLILGTGTASMVKVWDVKTQDVVVRFKEERLSPVTSISFSENGYYLAAAARDGVRLYDLRRSSTSFRSFNPYDENTATQCVEFDHSGKYFAFGGAGVRVYQTGSVKSEWNCVKTFPDLSGTGKVTCAKFGADAKYLAIGSMDRNLRIYGLPEEASSEA